MAQIYTPLIPENFLVSSDNNAPKIVHESFYDYHVMNIVENIMYSGQSQSERLNSFKAEYLQRIKKINEELDNMHIYKYIDIRNLSYILKSNLLYLDRVTDAWEDPYENFFLKEKFKLKDGRTASADNNLPGVFGQSWTYKEETDAMWRIYSQHSLDMTGKHRIFHGIRIETTARKLLNVIYVDDGSMADTWIGKVNYLDLGEINKQLQEGVQNIYDYLGTSFFIKRKEFEHESEFRVMKLVDSSTIAQAQEYKRIAFSIPNIADFINHYTLDPRLSQTAYEFMRSQLIELGVNPASISQSSLYKFEPVEVNISF